MAEITKDIFIVGTFVHLDPETKVSKEEYGPQVNLSEFIRNMKLPQRLLKTPAVKKTSNRRETVPKNINTLNTPHTQESVTPRRNTEAVKILRFQSVDTLSIPASSEAPASIMKVSSDGVMLRRAQEMFMQEALPNNITANSCVEGPNFNAMSEDEQISYALKRSMQVK